MKKTNTIVALLIVVAVGSIFSGTSNIAITQSAQAYIDPNADLAKPRAPMQHLKMATTSMSFGGLTGQVIGR